MGKFYFSFWISWVLRVVVYAVLGAVVSAFAISVAIYLFKSKVALSSEVLHALWQVFVFWFFVTLNITFLVAMFVAMKQLFNRCFDGYMLRLYRCSAKKEFVEDIGYGDLVGFMRKWFLTIVWITAGQMVLSVVVIGSLRGYGGVFEWFNIYILFIMIFLSGYITLPLVSLRCKLVRFVRCDKILTKDR